MLTEQEYVSGPEENYQWYENDLQLAAELGKTLLERNKDLENQLRQAHQVNHDQQREIDLLAKQLEALRGVSDSRMRIYEEVDKNMHELEKKNEKFRKDSRQDKAKIDELTGIIDSHEARIDELSLKIETLHLREQQTRSRSSRRTRSVPSLSDPDEYPRRQYGGFEDFPGFMEGKQRISKEEMKGLRTLQESIRNLKQQLTVEQRKKSDVENDLTEMVRENETLQVRVALLEQQEKQIMKLESELQEVEMRSASLCAQCGKSLESLKLLKKPEMSVEDDDLQEIPNGEFIRLKNGGSAYGSRESLNTLGLELETPIDEQLVTIFNTNLDRSPEEEPAPKSPGATKDEPCGSLLGELEDQYRSLVRKYESLIEAKSKRAEASDVVVEKETKEKVQEKKKRPSALPLKNKEVHTANSKTASAETKEAAPDIPSTIDFKSPLDPTEGRFENGPPEYKRLFQEIFQTLRRSIVEDELQQHELQQLEEETKVKVEEEVVKRKKTGKKAK